MLIDMLNLHIFIVGSFFFAIECYLLDLSFKNFAYHFFRLLWEEGNSKLKESFFEVEAILEAIFERELGLAVESDSIFYQLSNLLMGFR